MLLFASEIRRQIRKCLNDKAMYTVSGFAAKVTGNDRVSE